MAIPGRVNCVYPDNNIDVSTWPAFLCEGAASGGDASTLYIQVSTDAGFTNIVYDASYNDPPYDLSNYFAWNAQDFNYNRSQPDLEWNKSYYWRARLQNPDGYTDWDTDNFVTIKSGREYGGILKWYDGDEWQEVIIGDFTIYTDSWKTIDPSHFLIWRDNDWYPIRMANSYEQETLDLISRMTEAPSAGLQDLINTTIKSLKNYGIWNKLDVITFYALHTEQAALLDWKGYKDQINWLNMTFNPGIGFDNSDGTLRYINTQYRPDLDGSNFKLNDAMMGVWVDDNGDTTTNRALMGARASGQYGTMLIRAGSSLIGNINTADTAASSLMTRDWGMLSIDRDNATQQRGYVNGIAGNLTTKDSSRLTERYIWVGVAQSYTVYGYSMDMFKNSYLGAHLDPSEHQNFYNTVAYFNANASTYI